MQYFKPDGPYFVGDPMPFYHEGTFHLFYLLDQNHHQAKNGLGGHQWAHSSTTDLAHWEQHPIAISCTEDWEGSICTGSVLHHNGLYYAFYATRKPDRTQHLSLATSTDGVHFQKTQPNPFASPGDAYSPLDYRDPFVYQDWKNRLFRMLVTTRLKDYPIYGRGGCLLELTSTDLRQWQVGNPIIIPGGKPGYPSTPECPDFFYWNGWYYLVFGLDWVAHYRLSRSPRGPWLRPKVDVLDGSNLLAVMKTASFHKNRRIGVAFLGSRQGDKDDGDRMYAGNAVFREIIQHEDGSLGTRFPEEMVPRGEIIQGFSFKALTSGANGNQRIISLVAPEGLQVASLENIPQNARLSLRVVPEKDSTDFGLALRGTGAFEKGYELHFLPYQGKVTLNKHEITCVDGIDQSFSLEVVMKGDIVDICINNRRCLIDRCPEQKGGNLFFFCQNGKVTFDSIQISAL
jgi:hypothetical protein